MVILEAEGNLVRLDRSCCSRTRNAKQLTGTWRHFKDFEAGTEIWQRRLDRHLESWTLSPVALLAYLDCRHCVGANPGE